MLTITVLDADMGNMFVIACKANIDITDRRNTILLAKSIVETLDKVEDTINTVTTDCIDMLIKITEPQVKEVSPMFYSDN